MARNTVRTETQKTHDLLRLRGTYRGDLAWSFAELAGRLIEVSGNTDSAALTVACALVHDAQRRSEPAAWIARQESTFYPPDLAEFGVDLDALVVVRTPDPGSAVRSADRLLRSSAFGLVIADLGRGPRLPLPLLARLAGLARRHQAALVFLTEKLSGAPSLGPLVSMAITTSRQRLDGERFVCWRNMVKNKHGASVRGKSVACLGPHGLHHHS